MRSRLFIASIAVAVLGTAQLASAQSSTFNFEDLTDQGFGHKFSDDASETFPIVNIGGSNRMQVLRNGDFQEADRGTGNPAEAFYQAMLAAANNPAGYRISYDYYIDTSTFGAGAGTFLQLGTYVNSGSGYYAQNFPTTGKELELNGTQLASGLVFSGTISNTFAADGYAIPPADTFFKIGFIINGDGAAQTVYYDNVTISPVPESTALVPMSILPAFLLRRRRA
jgi:hypothetical protein